jgi:1-acyl-sn-glycerol-3-phosphate acyltransferase
MNQPKPTSSHDGLGNGWGHLALDMATRITTNFGFGLGFSYRSEGMAHVPKQGPVLVIANHQSFLDPPAIGLAFDRRLVYLARKTLFKNPIFATLIRGLGAVPIDQDGVGKEGLKAVVEQLRLGKVVLVFPEGSRTPDGELHELRPGIQMIIKRTSASILPVGIAGSYHAWPCWRKYPIPSPLFMPPTERTIAVSIGHPIEASRFATMERDEATRELGALLAEAHARAERLRRK